MDDYRYEGLQILTGSGFDAVQNPARGKQRFGKTLFRKCSGIAQDKDIANTGVTTIALTERFEAVDEPANAGPEELTAFTDEAGRGQFFRSRGEGEGDSKRRRELLSAACHSERFRESGHGRLRCLHARTGAENWFARSVDCGKITA